MHVRMCTGVYCLSHRITPKAPKNMFSFEKNNDTRDLSLRVIILFRLVLAAKIRKDFDTESIFPVFFEKSVKKERI